MSLEARPRFESDLITELSVMSALATLYSSSHDRQRASEPQRGYLDLLRVENVKSGVIKAYSRSMSIDCTAVLCSGVFERKSWTSLNVS